MTSVKQNFTMFEGDTACLVIGVTNAAGNAASLAGACAVWILEQSVGSGSLLRKTADDDITISGSTVSVYLAPSDTLNMDGAYYHELEITDSGNNVATSTTGTVRIKKSGAKL